MFKDDQGPLENVNKEQLIDGTLQFFLKLERENAINIYEAKSKKYEEQQLQKSKEEAEMAAAVEQN